MKRFRFFILAALTWLTGCIPPSPALGISPKGAVLSVGESVQLTATLFNTSVQSEIVWKSTGGLLSATAGTSVTFRAEQKGVYKVTATAVSDPTLTSTINLTVGQALTVGTSELPSLTGTTLAGGSSQTFVLKPVNFTKAALYAELVSPNALTVTLYTQTGERLASSDNPRFFSKNQPSNVLESNLLEAQRITSERSCRGPCIITPARNQGYIITITNNSATPATYALFLYNESFADSLESSENCHPIFSNVVNNLLTPTIEVIPPEPIVRALETVSDEDCFFSEAKAGEVVLETFSDTVLEVALAVYQVRSSVDTRLVGSLSAGPGRDDEVLRFDPSYPVLIVAKSGDGRAAASGGSKYAVNYY